MKFSGKIKPMQESWIKKELSTLRRATLVMVVVVFSAIGCVIGYFIFSDVLSGPFENVAYAQNGSTMEVTVETKIPSRARLEYGTAPEYVNRVPMGEEYETKHKISLSGLLPDKAHFFRIVLEDQAGRLHTSGFYTVN